MVCRQWGPVPVPPPGWTWESLMDEALQEAALAAACGEIPVGAVLVARGGEIVGRGRNYSVEEHDPSGHAEVAALRHGASTTGNYRLEGCVLVVTLEPCLMCTGAMVHARIAGVVYGAADMKAGTVESCLNGLELPFLNHHPWHMGGVRSEACVDMLKAFFSGRRQV